MENSKSITVLIQKDDLKSREWAVAAQGFNINIVPQKGSPLVGPLFLIVKMFKLKRPRAYILRYLNDYPSLTKSLLRSASELSLIILCKVFGVKIFWICHNVDRETSSYFPFLTAWRRRIVSFFSSRIFVTDELLVNYARKIFPKFQNKIESISFGELESRSNGTGDWESEEYIFKHREHAMRKNKRFLTVLCAGNPSERKYLHFPYLVNLINAANKANLYLIAIVAGKWQKDDYSKTLLSNLLQCRQVLVFENYTTFSEDFIKANIDFYFRGYDDYSVPFTVYEACQMEKPVLALNTGFLPTMIAHYDLGTCVETDFSDLEDALNKLRNNIFQFGRFRYLKQWSSLAEKLDSCLR